MNYNIQKKETIEQDGYFIQQFSLGCLAEFSYYVESGGEAAIIDPIRDVDEYMTLLKERKAQLKFVFETHLHADFVSGHLELSHKTGASIVFGPNAQTNYPIHQAQDGEIINLGKVQIRVDHTPGHTLESSCFVLLSGGQEKVVFTGDTLFLGEIGRPDLAVKSGNITIEDLAGLLFESLRNKIMVLPNDVILFPGHGSGSSCGKAIGDGNLCTIGKQKANNYALQKMEKQEFIALISSNLPKPPQYFFHDVQLNKNGPQEFSQLMTQPKALTYEQFVDYQKNGALILDSRSNIAAGVIPGSLIIGFASPFATFAGTLIKPNTQILVVAEPAQSHDTIMRLFRIGYDNVVGYLQGGFQTYLEKGGELSAVKITDLVQFWQPNGTNINQFSQDESVYLDVRNPPEYKEGVLPGAIKIPLSELEQRFQELPKDKKIHVYCKTGMRAKMGMSILNRNGFKNLVITQQGGFEAIVKANQGIQVQI